MTHEEELNQRIRKMMEEAGWDKLNEEELTKVVNEQLEVMVKLGQIEQLIGEDGEFYYKPIDGGTSGVSWGGISEYISRFTGSKFQFSCPICYHQISLPPVLIGKLGKCPSCSEIVLIMPQENEDE